MLDKYINSINELDSFHFLFWISILVTLIIGVSINSLFQVLLYITIWLGFGLYSIKYFNHIDIDNTQLVPDIVYNGSKLRDIFLWAWSIVLLGPITILLNIFDEKMLTNCKTSDTKIGQLLSNLKELV